ncbi:MAG: LysR family transcriptional regulator [Candidatus Eisenbacteria bacterium]|uniref:LysR family transcriptional regulator n=1 Tax=Eiseniibacteriota bacterium TaxID=2212470 RepID=A0A938BPX1_UNCEI|nr:LysR family transcriptional regulator [Candidatus Eisenbacteria bacterium]
MLNRPVPSTSMLLAFDMAARTGSFTAAARELRRTQGAVSKQILALEAQLGVALFDRRHNTVVLTEAGLSYARDVRAALDLIQTASMRVMANLRALTLAVLPTFGARWLMPRLPRFMKEHPGITVHMVTRVSPFDFRFENIDAAIHYGKPDWPNADCIYLMGEQVIPVCSPAFRAERVLRKPADLAGTMLLHIESRPHAWLDWFRAQGVEMPQCAGMYFEQFTTAAQAAAVGLGTALIPAFLLQDELERGELVRLFDMPYRSPLGYYLVQPDGRPAHGPLEAFKDWLLREVGKREG